MDDEIPKWHDEDYAAACANKLTVSLDRQATIKRSMRTTKSTFSSALKSTTMKTKTIIAAALAAGLALTTVRAADITPAETKAIAEEAFIYGLPIVMNYAVMYEFAVDKKSSQFKAPFNEINNLHHVATYKDTAVVTPNSDTPYSTLWLDLRAEPMGDFGACGAEGALLLGADDRRQYLQLWLHRQPRYRP